MLVDALNDADATVVNDFSAAKAVLRIIEEDYRREVRTLDNRGKVNGYTLIYSVSYEVVNANGEQISGKSSLVERADYNFDPVLVLGLEVEELEIREGMEEELVQRILRQLNSIAYSPLFGRQADTPDGIRTVFRSFASHSQRESGAGMKVTPARSGRVCRARPAAGDFGSIVASHCWSRKRSTRYGPFSPNISLMSGYV